MVVGEWNGMTLDRWRNSQPHVAFAQRLFKEPLFRDMLAVLQNVRPFMPTKGITDTEVAVQLGIRLGHDQLMGVLLQLPVMAQIPTEEVPADYGASDFDLNKAG